MTADAFHAQLTAQRADEIARNRYENSILKRLLKVGWPVRTEDCRVRRRKPRP